MYTGRNRNMSSISRNAVEKALPTAINIPIVGEFSIESQDFKGHGGKIDLDTYKYVHTTMPYGFVPESATYAWEEVKSKDGSIREYLAIDGCVLWTGRYEEAYSIIENGKGQSMEIEVTEGRWDDTDEIYHIDNFNFSALCILGDDTEPAFEDANITAYTLGEDLFKQELEQMKYEFELLQKGEFSEMLKKLLEKYSLKVEDLTAKGIDFNAISEDELEAKIIEVFEIDVEGDNPEEPTANEPAEPQEPSEPATQEPNEPTEPQEPEATKEPEAKEPAEPATNEPTEPAEPAEPKVDFEAQVKVLEGELATAKTTIETLETDLKELEDLRKFKLDIERANHEAEVEAMYNSFQLTEEEVKDIDIHKYSLKEIQDECFRIIGEKMVKKNFSKNTPAPKIKVQVAKPESKNDDDEYGGLLSKYNK